jgi:hypothetical protein
MTANQRFDSNEVERARLESEYKYVVDTQSKVVHAKREVAKNLKGLGVPDDKIANATGFSLDEIARL